MDKIKNAKRIVIKIGTSTITHASGHVNIRRVEELVKIISDIKNSGKEIIIVSSGAMAVGVGKLGFHKLPDDIPSKQAISSVGQCELMQLYERTFAEYNHIVSQILLTYYVITGKEKIQNVRNTVEKLMEYNIIPIINENDTVSTEEIEVGDNDTLSAMVANIIDADLLVLLTDIDGLYTCNPCKDENAKKIKIVEEITDDIKKIAEDSMSSFGTGGMITKVRAAELAMASGIDMMILSSYRPKNLYDLFDGKNTGTWFKCK